METLFVAVNLVALAGWVLLLLAPDRNLTKILVRNLFVPGLLCVIYAGFLVNEIGFGAASGQGGFTSIEAVRGLFAAPNGVLLGWTHYLAFDLFVGVWILEQSDGYNRWLVMPVLVATMLFGPVGLLLFLGVRRASPMS